MRSITRVADVSINTVAKILADAGEACEAFHDETVRNVKSKRIQCDEIWAFVYAKPRTSRPRRPLRMALAIFGRGPRWTPTTS